jgi:FKBP-type peptidyl-prolyl cis-trans isomerase SlyD
MQIAKHTVVALHYKLQEKDANGEMVEETFGAEPLVFLYGAGQMIPAFEEHLLGKEVGDTFAFGIPSAEAYGAVDQDAIISLPINIFEVDGQPDTEILQIGNSVPMSDDEGNQMTGTILEIKEEEVVMDFNHPMAGIDLYFTGLIESVRAATSAELEQGLMP